MQVLSDMKILELINIVYFRINFLLTDVKKSSEPEKADIQDQAGVHTKIRDPGWGGGLNFFLITFSIFIRYRKNLAVGINTFFSNYSKF